MKKIFILNLLFLINLIQSENSLEPKTFLNCKYLSGIYHPVPNTKLQDSDNLSIVINELKTLNEDLIKQRENKARLEGLLQQATEKQEDDKNTIYEKLNIYPKDFHKLIKINEDIPNLEESNLNLEKLLLQRERIGPVNLVAEEDSEKLIDKLKEIQNEKEDLENAVSKLRKSIRSINKEAKIRLMEAFTEVNKNFKILFTELFGGGEAYLALTESENPLESGLELMASPPGKKLQQMSLLSGGEQALTAMALIFSVFLTKPSPICILDEVDAPLDESNVDRFLDLIESISEKSKSLFEMYDARIIPIEIASPCKSFLLVFKKNDSIA